jgi:hypothetical protein
MLNDRFETVVISVVFDTAVEAVSRASVCQRDRAIDEKRGGNEAQCASFVHQRSLSLGGISASWFSRNVAKNGCMRAVFVVEPSRVCSNSFASGSTAFTGACSRVVHQIVTRSGDGVQPVLHIIESHHGFVDGSVI